MNDLSKYEKIANELLTKHELHDWKFVWNNRMTNSTWGVCKYRQKEIQLNRKYAQIESDENIIDTIIHEVAHALTKGDGHGEIWKAKCRELGCKDQQYKNLEKSSMEKLSRFKGYCPTCNDVIYAGRKKKYGVVCVSCCNKEYRATGNSNYKNHVYIWELNN